MFQNINARRGITLVEVLVVVVILVIAVGIMLPMLGGTRCGGSRRLTNATNLRSIHQAMFLYAMSNKTGGGDGYFPGLSARGEVVTIGPDKSELTLDLPFAADGETGDDPSVRFAILCDDGSITPALLVHPADSKVNEWCYDSGVNGGTPGPITEDHYSHALLSLLGSDNEKAEWKETANPDAVVLGDRAIGHNAKDISSVWTKPGSGKWDGSYVFNDGSTRTETSPVVATRYGDGQANPADHLFDDDPAADDAQLVYQDAATSYRPY